MDFLGFLKIEAGMNVDGMELTNGAHTITPDRVVTLVSLGAHTSMSKETALLMLEAIRVSLDELVKNVDQLTKEPPAPKSWEEIRDRGRRNRYRVH